MATSTNTAGAPAIREKELPPEIVKATAATTPATPRATPTEDAIERWRPLWWLPCELSLQIPVTPFTVGDLLRLRPGSLVSSSWSRSTEVPLYANGQRIGSGDFEAVGDRIGARITELA